MAKQQIFFVTIIYILSLYNVLAGRHYENLISLFGPPIRKEITTTQKPSIKVTYSQYRQVGILDNKVSDRASELSFTFSATYSRKFTPGIDISSNILGLEVSASIGGELSWSKTEPLTGKKIIPAKKVGQAFIRDKISTAIFKHKIQLQEKISGKWRNKGPAKTSISKVITTTPELKI